MSAWVRARQARLALAAVAALSVLAVAVGAFVPFGGGEGETREFTLEARQFAYSPERLRVSQGDRVILRLDPQDVSHGLYLDGYGLEMRANPDEGAVLEFVANQPGKFRFRCSTTCGPLHPFMIGELNVESGTPYTNTPFLGAVAATILVALGTVIYSSRPKGKSDGRPS